MRGNTEDSPCNESDEVSGFSPDSPSDVVTDIVKMQKPGTALDLGVGYGRDALFLAKQGFSVVGVDISEAAIGRFRDSAEKLGVEVKGIVGDIIQFTFDRKYDVVVSVAALNLIEREAAEELIRRVKANTEDGGLNALSVFTALVPLEGVRFLFKSNELRNLYEDWEIIKYEERATSTHRHENWPPHRHTNATLLARRATSNS